jgi:hypothetical protein
MSELALEMQEQKNQEAAHNEPHPFLDDPYVSSLAREIAALEHLNQLNQRDPNDQLPEASDDRSTEERNQDHADQWGY